MKVIAQLKLDLTPQQANALKRTLEAARAAANDIRDRAWDAKTLRLYDGRDRFNLAAQVTVRVIAKLADAHTLGRKHRCNFKPLKSMVDDKRSPLLTGR